MPPSEKEYEVECIRAARVSKKNRDTVKWEYYVKWKGWAEETNTWQNAADLKNSPKILKTFWNSADLDGRDHNNGRLFTTGEMITPQTHPLAELDKEAALVEDVSTEKRKRKHVEKDIEAGRPKKKTKGVDDATTQKALSKHRGHKSASAATDPSNYDRSRGQEKVSAPSNFLPSKALVPAASMSVPAPVARGFIGKFDLYFGGLSFLQAKLRPTPTGKPEYSAVYEEILKYQCASDYSLRLVLAAAPVSVSSTSQAVGRLSCSQVINPLSDEELIIYVDRAAAKTVVFTPIECEVPLPVGGMHVPGWEGSLRVDTEAAGCGMIESSSRGEMKMRKVWQSSTGAELLEGSWVLDVKYGSTLRRKVHDDGERYATTFWAVHALQKGGREVGIDLLPSQP